MRDSLVSTEPVLETTAVLLTNPEWRQRVVEKVIPRSADHYELRRSFQFEIPTGLVKGKHQDVLLPVCWLPKRALLDFDITDEHGHPLHILERRSIGGVMSEILDAWKGDIPALKDVDFDIQRIESVCSASLHPWETARRRALTEGKPGADSICDYLNALLPYRVSPARMGERFDQGLSLMRRLDILTQRDADQSGAASTFAVGPILAPYLVPRPKDQSELCDAIDRHHEAVSQAIEIAERDDDALGWLTVLADAGIKWPLLVRVAVPIGQPFLVKTRELRESGRPGDPRIFVHRSDLAAARSYHLHVQSPDQAVWIPVEPTARRADGTTFGALDLFENSDLTGELFTAYTSLDPRPDWVDFEIGFRLRWPSILGYVYALALVAAALLAAVARPVDAAMASVLTIPTTLASAFVLARDAPLAARFLRRWRLALIGLSLALWFVALWKATGSPVDSAAALG